MCCALFLLSSNCLLIHCIPLPLSVLSLFPSHSLFFNIYRVDGNTESPITIIFIRQPSSITFLTIYNVSSSFSSWLYTPFKPSSSKLNLSLLQQIVSCGELRSRRGSFLHQLYSQSRLVQRQCRLHTVRCLCTVVLCFHFDAFVCIFRSTK